MNPPLRLLFWAFAVASGWAPLVAAPIAAMLESAGIGSGDPERVRAIERWRLIDKVGAAIVLNAALALVAFVARREVRLGTVRAGWRPLPTCSEPKAEGSFEIARCDNYLDTHRLCDNSFECAQGHGSGWLGPAGRVGPSLGLHASGFADAVRTG